MYRFRFERALIPLLETGAFAWAESAAKGVPLGGVSPWLVQSTMVISGRLRTALLCRLDVISNGQLRSPSSLAIEGLRLLTYFPSLSSLV